MSALSPPLSPVVPDAAQAALARGSALHARGDLQGAIAAFEQAVQAAPAFARAQMHAGVARLQLRHWARGVAHLRVAVASDPSLAEAWSNLAFGWRELGRLPDARLAVDRALEIDPGLAPAWNLKGLITQDLGGTTEAEAHFARALELDPRFALAAMNLGNGHQKLGRLREAEDAYRLALSLDARLPEIHYNYAHLFHKSGRVRESLAPYREAIALDPGYALARNNLAHALFLLGELAPAWREYTGRANRVQHVAALAAQGRAYALPRPADIPGAHLLVRAEQGLGDVLFFLRFAPLLRAAGATLEFAGESRLAPLLARTGLFSHVGPSFSGAPHARAIEVLAGDLPLLLADNGVAPPPLALPPDAMRLSAMRERLARLGPPPWIGVAWRSGVPKVEMQETLYKEVPLEAFGAALAVAPGTLVALQREPAAGELEALARAAGRPVHDLCAVNEDLEEALAAMSALDEYVGVSSTNVHLRAGTGRTGRILVPFPPEWRWMAEGHSAWFPGFTVYRQDSPAGWFPALARLRTDLRRA